MIAPHPDDETLGCGGTLLRRRNEGAELGWLIVTGISTLDEWSEQRVAQRENEILQIQQKYNFSKTFKLNKPSTRLEQIPTSELIQEIGKVFQDFRPEEVFLPHPADAHSDHRITFDAVSACTKWFRYHSVKRVLAYETLSETEFGLGTTNFFQPNFFVDITDFLEAKLDAMSVYSSELGEFPFPRSIAAIRALAALRGTSAGYMAAEAFQLLRERQ